MLNHRRNALTRRDFLRGAAFVAAGGLLAACAPAGAPGAPAGESTGGEAAAPAAEGVMLQYWFGWGSTYAGQTWDALKATEELQTILGGSTIETKGSTNAEALLTAVAAGTPPDGASNTQYLDYMARGVLIPIDDWVANSEVVKKELY